MLVQGYGACVSTGARTTARAKVKQVWKPRRGAPPQHGRHGPWGAALAMSTRYALLAVAVGAAGCVYPSLAWSGFIKQAAPLEISDAVSCAAPLVCCWARCAA